LATPLSANFTLEEFQNASSAPLNESDVQNARYFANEILQPARNALGFPIKITSFKRRLDIGAHGRGHALDFDPCCVDLTTRQMRHAALFQWLAVNRRDSFGELGDERNHVHTTTPGYAGEHGQIWTEPREGVYVLARIIESPIGIALLVSVLILLLLTED
jgi:hypothetical protein